LGEGQRTLRVSFASAEDFRREYEANLANGGVFVEGDDDFELRETVRVELVGEFCGQSLELAGEVVHRVTPEFGNVGAPVGVAVQFDGGAQQVRERLEPLREASGAPPYQPADSGRRRSPRAAARVAARLGLPDGPVSGHTRDISRTGALVSVPGTEVAVGERFRIALRHPTRGDTLEVDAVVVRRIESKGAVAALGIEFEPDDEERPTLEEFVDGIQSAEHARGLGGIQGEIGDLAVQDVIQMFSTTVSAGTLTLRRGPHEAVLGFDKGLLRFARVGAVSGLKALVRMLGWSEGHFTFHARLDPVAPLDAPLPVEAALLEALRLLDEARRPGRRVLPGEAVPRLAKAGAAGDDLSKLEAAVLDLVRVGFSVQRMMQVIPEPDPEIQAALESLLERGVICV
jgi:Tfp pilus assembly protein PilZ